MSKFETMNGNGGPDLEPTAHLSDGVVITRLFQQVGKEIAGQMNGNGDLSVGQVVNELLRQAGKEVAGPAAAGSVLVERGILAPLKIDGLTGNPACADAQKPLDASQKPLEGSQKPVDAAQETSDSTVGNTDKKPYTEKEAIAAAEQDLRDHNFEKKVSPDGDRTYSLTMDGKKYKVDIEFQGDGPKVSEVDDQGNPKSVDAETNQKVLDLFKDLTNKTMAINVMKSLPLNDDQQHAVERMYQAFQNQDHNQISGLAKLFSGGGPECFKPVLAHLFANHQINGERLKADYRFNSITSVGKFSYIGDDHQKREVILW